MMDSRMMLNLCATEIPYRRTFRELHKALPEGKGCSEARLHDQRSPMGHFACSPPLARHHVSNKNTSNKEWRRGGARHASAKAD